MAMQGGQLRHRVTLQAPAGARNALGERDTTWTTVATVWAAITPLSTRDLIAAAATQNETTQRVLIRAGSHIAALDSSWRVLFGARVLVITGIRRIDEIAEQIELQCSEGLRTE